MPELPSAAPCSTNDSQVVLALAAMEAYCCHWVADLLESSAPVQPSLWVQVEEPEGSRSFHLQF